jgi:hypothetical protein
LPSGELVVTWVVMGLLLTDVVFVWPSPCALVGFAISQIAGVSDREVTRIMMNINAKKTLYPRSIVRSSSFEGYRRVMLKKTC